MHRAAGVTMRSRQGVTMWARPRGERVIFFDERALAAIRDYLPERGDNWWPLFLYHNRGGAGPGPDGERWRLETQSVWLIVGKYAKQLGIQATPHGFRHALACRMLNNGAQMSHVEAVLGHQSLATTSRIYARYDVKSLERLSTATAG
jgi:integrase/recombinase XerD